MRRALALLLVLVMALGLVACGSSSSGGTQTSDEPETTELPQIRVGMECAYPPNNWMEDTAREGNVPIENVPGSFAAGYDVEIARRIADEAGYELVVVMLAWDGLIEALNQGQIDLIIAGMADTAERREAINFSDPYHTTEYGIMLKAGSPYENATTIHDFAGAAVLGQKDTKLDTVIDQMDGVEHLNPVSSVPNMISRLQEDACDAIVVNVENTPAYLDANPDFRVIRFAQGDGFDLGFVGACVGIRLTDNELLDQVNAALATISEDTRTELWNQAVEDQPR